MNILYLGNFDNVVAEYISRTFEELGHTIKRRHEESTTVEQLQKMIESEKFDFVLTEEARLKYDYIYGEVLDNELDRCNGGMKRIMDMILVVPWLTNIFWGIERRVPLIEMNPIFKAPIVFTTDGGHDKEWKEAGVNHHLLRQGVYQGEAKMGKKLDMKCTIGFVGEMNSRIWNFRESLVKYLIGKYGNDFIWVGQGASAGIYYGKELNDFLATMKVIVGDSVLSPYYWSNRVYEMIGRGGFLIMPEIKGLDKEFEPYKHYVPYKPRNLDDLKEKIDYYLEHEEEREQIRKAGFEYCKKNYTYKHRVIKMLKVLEENKLIS